MVCRKLSIFMVPSISLGLNDNVVQSYCGFGEMAMALCGFPRGHVLECHFFSIFFNELFECSIFETALFSGDAY